MAGRQWQVCENKSVQKITRTTWVERRNVKQKDRRKEIGMQVNSLSKKLVSLHRLSVGCGTTPRRQSGVCDLLNIIRVGLNNAATSRILVNYTVF